MGSSNTSRGFCVSILQEDSHAVQYPKSFLVLDNSDIDAMLNFIGSFTITANSAETDKGLSFCLLR